MQRVLSYCEWKAAWWRDQPALRLSLLNHNPGLIKGLKAYGEKQAALEDLIWVKWTAKQKAARDCTWPIVNNVLGPELDDIELAGGGSEPETVVEIDADDNNDEAVGLDAK